MLHIPDIGMPPPLYLLLRLVDCFAEAVIDLLMDSVFILIPDKAGDMVDGGFKKMTGFPEIFGHLIALLPPQKMETDFLPAHRHLPYLLYL